QIWVAINAEAVPPVLLGKYGPYSQWLTTAIVSQGPAFLVQVAWKNLIEMASLGWSVSTGTLDAGLATIVPGALGGAALLTGLGLGLVRFWRKAPVTTGFLAIYLLVVMLWPFAPTRFLTV